MPNAEEVVLSVLRKLGCQIEILIPVQELQGSLGIDSTEMVDLASLVRTECGMVLQSTELRHIHTVADLTSRIDSFLAAQK